MLIGHDWSEDILVPILQFGIWLYCIELIQEYIIDLWWVCLEIENIVIYMKHKH
jgi:hypothetical protein